MEFAGVEYGLLPATTQLPPAREKRKAKDPKVWLAGELIIRCERQGITELPPQLLLKCTVRKLILTGNQLDSLPAQLFQQLRELRELKLGHNRLQLLSEDIQHCPHLELLGLQHNVLQDVPASLCKCARLKLVNLDGNPLCDWLRQLWLEAAPAAAAATVDSASSNDLAGAGSICNQQLAAAAQRLKANTQALLDHLLQSQDAETVQQVQAVRLAVLQDSNRARVHKLLNVADFESIAEAHRLATAAQLEQQVLSEVQDMRAAVEALQAAVQQVQQHQQRDAAVPADVQEQLAAGVRRVEQLCKPDHHPSGALYATAHSLLRTLQRQQQERGWRCGGSATPHGAGQCAIAVASCTVAGGLEGLHGQDSNAAAAPRRFLTSAERQRQHLAAHGAKTHQQWSVLKQEHQGHQQRLVKELLKAEVEGLQKTIADRAAHALENCERERQWPSRRVDAYPPGTFSLSPQRLQAVRKAYHRPPLLQ